MGPAQDLDRVGQLQYFFLSELLRSALDPRRSIEDREEQRARLEAYLIAGGPPMLQSLRRAFAFCDVNSDASAVEWLIGFVAPLGPEWIQTVDLNLVERYWKVAPNRRAKNLAAEFITREEFSQPNPLAFAPNSRLVQRFRLTQGSRRESALAPEAQQIVDVLLTRAALTPAWMLNGLSLGRYSLYVLRYCFVDQGLMPMDPERAQGVLGIASELTPDRQELFRHILLTTL